VNDNLTDEQRNIISKVEKLMRLAGRNPNEAEAAAASAKAMELLAEDDFLGGDTEYPG
jgi:hypothetical protein